MDFLKDLFSRSMKMYVRFCQKASFSLQVLMKSEKLVNKKLTSVKFVQTGQKKVHEELLQQQPADVLKQSLKQCEEKNLRSDVMILVHVVAGRSTSFATGNEK